MTAPAIGAERYTCETIDVRDCKRIAKKHGWKGGEAEGLLDYCNAGEDARKVEHFATFDKAVAEAQIFERSGNSLFGASRVEHEIFEQAHDDRDRRVEGGSWETQAAWEVCAKGEPERIDE